MSRHTDKRASSGAGNPFIITTPEGYEIARFIRDDPVAFPNPDIELLMNGAAAPHYGDWCGARFQGNGSNGGYCDFLTSDGVRRGTIYAYGDNMNVSAPNGTSQGFSFGVGNPGNWKVTPAGNLVCATNNQFGYAVGSGGSQVQAPTKVDDVIVNASTGEIATANSNLAGGAIAAFTLQNFLIEANDHVLISHVRLGSLGAYNVCATSGIGGALITLRNLTAGALAEAIILKFTVIKGAIT